MLSSHKYEWFCSELSWISFWKYPSLREFSISLFVIELVILWCVIKLFFFCQHLRHCARSLKRHLRKLRKQIAQARSVTILWLLQPKNYKESFSQLLNSEIVTTGLSVPLVMVVLFCWVIPKCRTARYHWTQLLESPVRTQSISSMRKGFCEAVVNKKRFSIETQNYFSSYSLGKADIQLLWIASSPVAQVL